MWPNHKLAEVCVIVYSWHSIYIQIVFFCHLEFKQESQMFTTGGSKGNFLKVIMILVSVNQLAYKTFECE